MKLKVGQLHPGENVFQYKSPKDTWLNEVEKSISKQGYPFQRGIELELNVTKLDPDFLVRGRMAFEASRTCDRCAEPFPISVKHPFHVAYVRAQKLEGDEDLDQTVFDGDEIDLAPLVEEQFHLSLPFAALCQEDCQGICQSCGQNKNLGDCTCAPKNVASPFSELAKLRDSGR